MKRARKRAGEMVEDAGGLAVGRRRRLGRTHELRVSRVVVSLFIGFSCPPAFLTRRVSCCRSPSSGGSRSVIRSCLEDRLDYANPGFYRPVRFFSNRVTPHGNGARSFVYRLAFSLRERFETQAGM